MKHQLGTLWYFNIAIENGNLQLIYPLKIVIFHSFLYVYQKVSGVFFMDLVGTTMWLKWLQVGTHLSAMALI